MTLLCLLLPVLPARAGEDAYSLDKPHTQIMFSVDHMGFSRSHGRFLGYDGQFMMDDGHPEKSSVEAVIHTNSVDMGDPAWDKAVKGIFKTDRFPDMTFKSTAVKQLSKNTADVAGDLTLLGVTKPSTLHVTFNKEGRNPFGKYICGFSASADIKRSEFGMKDYLPMVGDDVHIVIEVEGVRHDKPGQGQYNQ